MLGIDVPRRIWESVALLLPLSPQLAFVLLSDHSAGFLEGSRTALQFLVISALHSRVRRQERNCGSDS